MTMSTVVDVEISCIERLQQEAIDCLNTFPGKIIELNELVQEYMPDSMKNNVATVSSKYHSTRSQSTIFVKDSDLSNSPEFDNKSVSYYSLSACNQNRLRRGISKRRYYRMQNFSGTMIRRRPGPLGQLLTFIASRLAFCTKKIIIAPSYYIINSIISTFFQSRHQVKSVQCGPSTSWDSSLSTYMTSLKDDNTVIGTLINIMRPAAVQLIADTTILKRWLMSLTLQTKDSSPIELANATRTTETIDGWAYELFFHLKYLQANRSQRTTDETPVKGLEATDDTTHANLWHRLVQLRDNYIILYENLFKDKKIHDNSTTTKET